MVFAERTTTIAEKVLDHFGAAGYNTGMRGGKGSEYDGGHRVPWFIHWPTVGITGGRDVDRITAGIDVLSTLAELCEINEHSELVGRLRGAYEQWWAEMMEFVG